MIELYRQQSWADRILFIVGFGCLIATAVQYPLSTTFPAGGDAAAHITTVQHVISRPLYTAYLISQSWYPVTYTLFSLNGFIPFISWTHLYTWWMALGQIFTGLTIALLLFRLSGIRAAAIGMALWGMTPIALTSFFEDATMAQLWSLPWLILFFEGVHQRSIKGVIIFLFLALFSHPITGLILLTTVTITTPQLWIMRTKIERAYMYSAVISSILVFGILIARSSVFSMEFQFESSRYIQDLLHSFFLPWVLASIYGWYVIVQTQKSKILFLVTISNFFFLSFLMALNDKLGVGFWTNRLSIYLTLCIIIAGSIGFAAMIKTIRPIWVTTIFCTSLLIALTLSVFHDNMNIYRRFESPSTYTRIHPDELAAIAWIKDHVPSSANILTSKATRNYEWIPVLSGIEWDHTIGEQLKLLEKNIYAPYTLVVYFTKTEKVPDVIKEKTNLYHLEYENKGAAIYHITPL